MKNWMKKAILLGLSFWIALVLVKPVGVSTEFEVVAELLKNALTGQPLENPISYGMVFVLAMPVGAWLGNRYDRKKEKTALAEEPFSRKEFALAFCSGFFLLLGARIAGGCTSGHMMSGMMQGSVSGFIFAAAVFLVAIPVAIFRKK